MTPAQFYQQVQPLAEQMLDLAREWRDAAPADPAAVEAHSEAVWLVLRIDLRRSRAQDREEVAA